MIYRCKRSGWIRDFESLISQHTECLGTGHFVYQVQGDKYLALPTLKGTDEMGIPNFLKQIPGHNGSFSINLKSQGVLS
jgi:hypothetical protein